jgi:hypothetical protein
MMLQSHSRHARAILAALLLNTTVLAAAGGLAMVGVVQPASAQQSTGPATASPADHVETRISELHTKLQITPAQEPQWKDFAQVMRDNAKATGALLDDRSHNVRAMSAVDDLKSYLQISEAHTNGLKKLIPAFQTLYDTMSPEQKKTADAVFRTTQRMAGQHGSATPRKAS